MGPLSRSRPLVLAAALICILAMIVQAPRLRAADDAKDSGQHGQREQHERHDDHADEHGNVTFSPGQQRSVGSVMIDGQKIDYVAYAGTIVVHPKDWSDVAQNHRDIPEASMFYVAYFRVFAGSRHSGDATSNAAPDLTAVGSPSRPITFLYNGGPGSSSVWLHMGAFGPRRVVTNGDSYTPAAPYRLVNNEDSLLDASDLVFIDAPGTGFSRIAGKNHDKEFYGVDQDAYAFSDFIVQFLSKYGRWNSPKYLFGESYGTTRSAVLANLLETERDVNLNGVILLSQILNFDDSADAPQFNPGVDLPYELALPTYAASAWFHHRLPGPQRELAPLLGEVEHFAMNDYALALEQGTALPEDQRRQIAQRLRDYTGLSLQYILDANLRIDGGEFEKSLQGPDITTGRLDTRFSGPAFDPLAEEAEYDPQLHVLLNAGYFDLATPFYEGVYEMRHLAIPKSLTGNISFAFYPTGHMVYVSEDALRQLHKNVADFIRSTETDQAGEDAPAASGR